MTPEMKIWMDVWLKHKQERKEPYHKTGLTMIKNRALKWGEARFIAAVEFSVRNNYSGLFEPTGNSAEKTAEISNTGVETTSKMRHSSSFVDSIN